jgi:hypothetical protein
MQRAFGAHARTMRAHIARKNLFASLHDATTRSQLQN